MSPDLRRHDLVRLTRAGWRRLQSTLPAHRALLERWSERDHPAVIARHRATPTEGWWSAGLPAPLTEARLRVAFDIASEEIAAQTAFPHADAVGSLATELRRELGSVAARVYGAHGWQAMTGECYVHPRSDIDLLVDVVDDAHADAIVGRLAALANALPLDGELLFPDGRAVAWREWAAWRAGRVAHVLVKRIDGVTLEAGVLA